MSATRTMRKSAWALGTILAAPLALYPVLAQAQSVVHSQLQLLKTAVLYESDFQQTHAYKIGYLNNGASRTYDVTLRGDWQYGIASVCDEDCSDLDVEVFDENGNLIDKDVAVDDTPIVEVRPLWTGRFTIKVTMYECSYTPCSFGIGIFGAPR